MPIVLAGIVMAVALGVGAAFVLIPEREPSWEAYSTSSTRVGDPGHNLVGRNWTGDPNVGADAPDKNS